MRQRRFRSMLVPKAMRLLVIAASGLAVGLAITVARGWQPHDMSKNKGNKGTSAVSKYEDAELAARAQNAKGPNGKGQKGLLAARIPTLSGKSGETGAGSGSTAGTLPLTCFDASGARKLDICSDSDLRDATTIDWKVQKKIAAFMRRRPVVAAAYVAVDIETGAVRSLLSHDPS